MSERKQSPDTDREVVFDGENIAEWFRFDRQVLRRAKKLYGKLYAARGLLLLSRDEHR